MMIMIDDYEWWLWFMIMIYDDVQPSIPIPIPTPATRPRRIHVSPEEGTAAPIWDPLCAYDLVSLIDWLINSLINWWIN